jgi:phosphosulfolactate phosphohydrolase-like enzyme
MIPTRLPAQARSSNRAPQDGRKLETARITNSPAELRRAIAGAGTHPKVVLEATYGWYWAADTLAAAGRRPD